MKTIIFLLVLMMAAPVGAQITPYGSDDVVDKFRRDQEIENQRRRIEEIERRQRAEEQRRLEAERHRNNPLLSERERQKCRPGQFFC